MKLVRLKVVRIVGCECEVCDSERDDGGVGEAEGGDDEGDDGGVGVDQLLSLVASDSVFGAMEMKNMLFFELLKYCKS
jgi:ethanolamine utilization protein EutQ (cupin superfamily)